MIIYSIDFLETANGIRIAFELKANIVFDTWRLTATHLNAEHQ